MDGRLVRHALAHSVDNLYEFLLDFSACFLRNEEDLDRFFVAQGTKDNRAGQLRKAPKKDEVMYAEYQDMSGWTCHKELIPGQTKKGLDHLKEKKSCQGIPAHRGAGEC